jgi:hypothetical protein
LTSYSPDLNPIEQFFQTQSTVATSGRANKYQISGAEFVCFFARFARKNALISCDTQVMYQHEREVLY